MLAIYDGREAFYQWDSGQKLLVSHDGACEVHYKNRGEETALTVDTYILDGKVVADVPNILLQEAGPLTAYIYVCVGDACTIHKASFPVRPRQRPADYIYTETDIKTYAALEKRLDEIEANGVSDQQVEKAVTRYLEENPIDTGGVVRFDEAQALTEAQQAQARANLGIVAYEGTYTVTPSTDDAVTLKTAQKLMDADVHVKKIPFFDVTNERGGSTVYIGVLVEDDTTAELGSAVLDKMKLA